MPCLGCGGLVPDIDGPSHRYILASPGCWAAYTEGLAAALVRAPVPDPFGTLTVDAYAVQHPGVPNSQATQSVWVHLITLHLVLEAGWPGSRAIGLRTAGADRSAGWPWLTPPASMGALTAIDVVLAEPGAVGATVRGWVEDAWQAWSDHHDRVRAEASRIVSRFR